MKLSKGMMSTQSLFVTMMVGLVLSLPVPVQGALFDRGWHMILLEAGSMVWWGNHWGAD